MLFIAVAWVRSTVLVVRDVAGGRSVRQQAVSLHQRVFYRAINARSASQALLVVQAIVATKTLPALPHVHLVHVARLAYVGTSNRIGGVQRALPPCRQNART